MHELRIRDEGRHTHLRELPFVCIGAESSISSTLASAGPSRSQCRTLRLAQVHGTTHEPHIMMRACNGARPAGYLHCQ